MLIEYIFNLQIKGNTICATVSITNLSSTNKDVLAINRYSNKLSSVDTTDFKRNDRENTWHKVKQEIYQCKNMNEVDTNLELLLQKYNLKGQKL